MSIAQSLLPEFDHEMANTRKTLERVPEDKLEFKPDPKSMTLGHLAGHIADMLGWGTATLTTDSLDMDPATYQPLVATSRTQLVAAFDKNLAQARAALAGASDADLMKEWSFKVNGQTILSMPRVAVLRSMVMNHIIHHRAQLTVYYRLTGVPVPGLYGPSADEGQMTASA
jgi:uncharacterized damage-inducible protein DinB